MEHPLVQHLIASFDRAQREESKITPEILALEGMSGRRTRHFYNNLCSMPDARYIEIGVWWGSTFCSAMMNNSATMMAIDNWVEWVGANTPQIFIKNVNRFNKNNRVAFVEADCWKIDTTALPKFNIYVYDGGHTFEDHYKSLTHYLPCMDSTFIFVVDDWNVDDVRAGTRDAIKDLGLVVLHEIEHRTTFDGTHPEWGSLEQLTWHNGMYAAVIQKP